MLFDYKVAETEFAGPTRRASKPYQSALDLRRGPLATE
jgi:hypothetical protein